jgi:hypothetical protein
MKKIITFLLAILMLLSVVACAKDNEKEKGNDQVDSGVEKIWDKKELDFEGFTFIILGKNNGGIVYGWDGSDLDSEEVTGNEVLDEVYNRNRLIEEKYNCVIKTEEAADLKNTLMAGTDEDGSLISNTISFAALETDNDGRYILPPINGKYGLFYIDSVIGISRNISGKTFVSSNGEDIYRITGSSTASISQTISIDNQDTIILFSSKDVDGNDIWLATVIPYWIYGRESSDSVANIQQVSTPEEATSPNVLYIITG